MKLKSYINDQFMIYCFECGFENAIAMIEKDLKEINLQHFIHQDLFKNDPISINEKTESTMDDYKMLLNKTKGNWFLLYRDRITGYQGQKRLFNQLEKRGFLPIE